MKALKKVDAKKSGIFAAGVLFGTARDQGTDKQGC